MHRCTRPSLTAWLITCKGIEAARAIERAGDHPDDRQHHQGDKPHQGETTAPRIQSERAGEIPPRSGSSTPGDPRPVWCYLVNHLQGNETTAPRGSPPRLVLPGDYLVTPPCHHSPPDPQRIQGMKQHPRRCTDAQMHRPSLTTWLTTCKGKEAARAIERAGDRPEFVLYIWFFVFNTNSVTAPRIPAHAPPIVDTIMPGSPARLVLPGDYLVTPPCHHAHQIPRGSRE